VSTSFLINNIKAVTPSALIKTIKVVIPFSGDALRFDKKYKGGDTL
jgi:hypothetical protein